MYRFILIFAVILCNFPQQGNAQESVDIFVQKGHSGMVTALAISQDGQFALSGGSDKKLIYWDIRNGKEIRTWDQHAGIINAVAFSPDGKTALSASVDNTVKIWSLITGQEILTLSGFASVQSIAFSPDGQHVLLGEAGGYITLLYKANWHPTFRFNADSGEVTSVAFSPNGKLVVSGYSDSTLKLWDSETGDLVRTFSGHRGRVTSLAFSPDGLTILSGSVDKTLRLWDVKTGNNIRAWVGHTDKITSVAFSPNGKQVASASLANTNVILWDIDTGKEIRSFDESPVSQYELENVHDNVSSITFSSDGKTILAGSLATMKLWDVATGKKVRTFTGAASRQTSLAISPDGTQILNGMWDPSAKPAFNLWSLTTGKGIRGFHGHTKQVNSVAFSPDGLHALTASDDKTLKIWDIDTGAEIQTFTGHTDLVFNAAFSPDGRLVISSSAQLAPGKLKLWDVASGKEILNFSEKYLDSKPIPVVFSPDGKYVLTASQFMQDFDDDGGVYKDMASGEEVTSTYVRHSLNLLNVSSGKTTNTFFARRSASGYFSDIKTGHSKKVISVAVSPDGRFALTGSLPGSLSDKDTNLRLWDIKSGEEVRGFKGHVGRVTSVAFSPDGRMALSGEGFENGKSDLLVKLWDVATGQEIRSFSGHTDDILAVSFSKDGRQAISASSDQTTRVWEVSSGKEIIQHVHFKNDEWISIMPNGYFSASSAKIAENLNIRIGMTIYGIDQFYDVFYRPDIVEAALAGNDTSSMVTLTINEALKSPPPVIEKVEVPNSSAANTIKVAFRIKSKGGGIGDVRVFHNGKLIKSDGVARNIPDTLLGKKADEVTSDVLVSQMRALHLIAIKNESFGRPVMSKPKHDLYESVVEIEPVPGENDISVIAFNAQNSIQSVARTETFTSNKAAVLPQLYILAVGIDEYKDKSSNLLFAVKDSHDLAAEWKAQAANIYGEKNIFMDTISNMQASREGILAKINKIAARVKPTDHFVLFIASHGVLLGEQYYMVTSDYDGALQPSKLISANEIVDFSKRIKALSQLYILDTCHAGGMGGVISGLYDARMSVLAKKMGLHVFASASSAEEAIDGFDGNGLFTHTLLAGLNNNNQADTNSDKQISLMELGTYSKAQTKEIAKKLGHKQDPLIVNFGGDNPIYRLQ